MNETRGNLEVRGYVHVGNRDLTPDEKAGMKREGLIRILVSVVLWLLFPMCLFVALGGFTFLSGDVRAAEQPMYKVLALLSIVAVLVEALAAVTQGRRGRHLRADARAGVVNVYEHRQVHPQQLPQFRWKQTPVTQVEVLPRSERVWKVNGTPLKNGWDALSPSLVSAQLGLGAIK